MFLIETPEQELQMQLGQLLWQTIALRNENARLRRELEALQPKEDDT